MLNFLFLGEDRFCASSCFLNLKINGNAPFLKVFLPIFVENRISSTLK